MKFGVIAKDFGKRQLPLEVLQSRAGFYIGTQFEGGPFSRESMEYWPKESAAKAALIEGLWTQRDHP